jgi:hypothetical protein
MYVFGGYEAGQAKYSNIIYRFDFESEKWEVYHQPNKETDGPVPRSSFGMDVANGDIWVFGGTDGTKQLNDLWCFNIGLKRWKLIQTEDQSKVPEPRRNLTLAAFRDNLFIFGGILDVTKEKNDIYVYDIKAGAWSKIHNSTNSIYECSPTLKQRHPDKKAHEGRLNSPSKAGPNFIPLIPGSTVTSHTHAKEDNDKVMHRILEENRHKKFLEHKRQMLKEFDTPP